MLKEMLGVRTGILEILHNDHEEVSALLARILETSGKERGELFREMKAKLLAHAKAEAKVLYRKLERSEDEKPRQFAREGDVEHELVESQLEELSRARSKDGEPWTARLTVLQELVRHHVREEEGRGFASARQEFDDEALEKLGEQFEREKEKLL